MLGELSLRCDGLHLDADIAPNLLGWASLLCSISDGARAVGLVPWSMGVLRRPGPVPERSEPDTMDGTAGSFDMRRRLT